MSRVSEWRDSETRFDFPCGCVYYREFRSLRGVAQWRIVRRTDCQQHQEGN